MQWILWKNQTQGSDSAPGDCAAGCLFNVEDDPSESVDLSHDPAQKEPTSCAAVSGASYIKQPSKVMGNPNSWMV